LDDGGDGDPDDSSNETSPEEEQNGRLPAGEEGELEVSVSFEGQRISGPLGAASTRDCVVVRVAASSTISITKRPPTRFAFTIRGKVVSDTFVGDTFFGDTFVGVVVGGAFGVGDVVSESLESSSRISTTKRPNTMG
jgi:hypothetical protein